VKEVLRANYLARSSLAEAVPLTWIGFTWNIFAQSLFRCVPLAPKCARGPRPVQPKPSTADGSFTQRRSLNAAKAELMPRCETGYSMQSGIPLVVPRETLGEHRRRSTPFYDIVEAVWGRLSPSPIKKAA
jgi:hypothetical protein